MDKGRKFSIADATILIAGLATSFAIVRASLPAFSPVELWRDIAHPKGGWSFQHLYGVVLEVGLLLLVPFLAGWTPACLLLNAVKPRPTGVELRQRPGFIACVIGTATSMVAIVVGAILGWLSSGNSSGVQQGFEAVSLVGSLIIGSGVAWSWTVMGICGVYRAAPTWLDRLGRATGIAWITCSVISATYAFMAVN